MSNYTNAELIYDSNGNGIYDSSDQIASTYGYSNYSGSISKTLGTGTYFVRVYSNSAEYNTNYTLNLSATPTTPASIADPGNTLSSAYNIDSLSGIRNFTQFVGSADRNDYYRFRLDRTSTFNLDLSGLSDSTYVQLISGTYQTITSTYGSSSSSGSISRSLGAGTYFVRVYTDYYSYNTNYFLRLSAA